MDKSERIVKDSMIFSGGTYLSYIFKLIGSVVIRKFLSPTVMGLFSELMLVFQFGRFHHLGILNSLDREIPFYRGKDDVKKVAEIKDIGFTFCLLTSLVVAACLLLISGYLSYTGSHREFRGGLFLVAILIVVEIIVAYYRVMLRTHNKFYLLARLNILLSVIEVIATVILVILYGFKGALLAMILTGIIASGYLFRFSGFRFMINFRFPKKEIIRLFKIGFPLEISSLTRRLFLNADKLMIIFLLGRVELGLYSVGVMVYNFLTPLHKSVYNVMFPKFYEDYARSEDINKVSHYLLKPTIAFAYIFPIIIGTAIILLPLLTKYVLPKYEAGLFPAYILILSTFFNSLVVMWGYLMIALYRQVRRVQFNLMAIGISIFLNYLFVKGFGMGLNGIALGTVLAHLILTTVIISYTFSFYTKEIKEHLYLFLKLYLPFIWVVFVLFLLSPLFDYDNQFFIMNLLYCAFSIGALILFCSPCVYYANKETGILNLAFKVFRDKVIELKGPRRNKRL